MYNNILLETQNVLLRKHYLHVIFFNLLSALGAVLMAVPMRSFFQLPFASSLCQTFLSVETREHWFYQYFVVKFSKCIHFRMQ